MFVPGWQVWGIAWLQQLAGEKLATRYSIGRHFYSEAGSNCISGCPGTYYVVHAGFGLIHGCGSYGGRGQTTNGQLPQRNGSPSLSQLSASKSSLARGRVLWPPPPPVMAFKFSWCYVDFLQITTDFTSSYIQKPWKPWKPCRVQKKASHCTPPLYSVPSPLIFPWWWKGFRQMLYLRLRTHNHAFLEYWLVVNHYINYCLLQKKLMLPRLKGASVYEHKRNIRVAPCTCSK